MQYLKKNSVSAYLLPLSVYFDFLKRSWEANQINILKFLLDTRKELKLMMNRVHYVMGKKGHRIIKWNISTSLGGLAFLHYTSS